MDILTLSLAVKKALAELGVKVVKEKNPLFPLTEVEFAENPGMPGMFVRPGVPITLAGETTYVVNLDGVDYTCVSVVTEDEAVVLGNQGLLMMGDDNGMPFVIMGYPEDGEAMMATNASGSKHTISISEEVETIVPIDQKYLPGVCLPVVEIADISAITAEEGAELGKHIGIPVVIKVTIDGTLNCCVFNYTYVDAYRTHLYGATIGTDAVILTSSDGVSWTKG